MSTPSDLPRRPPTSVTVELGERSYEILIGRDLVDTVGEQLAERLPGARMAIVTDENVAEHHLHRLTHSLEAAEIEYVTVVVPPGEGSKSFPAYETVVEALLESRIERNDAVLAFGGGVVGDLAGFAAGTVLRGIRFVQLPTTLLSQVDSSIGGKTGINTGQGKNLVGVFHQPSFVLSDSGILDSLPEREFNAGYAEVAKCGLIGAPDFFSWLETNWRAVAAGWPEREQAIASACRAKAAIVAADERESGIRALLNLGHTCRLDDVKRVEAHLKDVGLPTRISQIPGGGFDVDTLLDLMAQDKKVSRGKLTFILAKGIGRAFIAKDVPVDKVRLFLEDNFWR
ncbi:MAG: 3-dehydroquinate synthase [Rhizobiales bacterium]|nr:3-dehydroquinate synthase [Hyphomicrobiales bacterium]